MLDLNFLYDSGNRPSFFYKFISQIFLILIIINDVPQLFLTNYKNVKILLIPY